MPYHFEGEADYFVTSVAYQCVSWFVSPGRAASPLQQKTSSREFHCFDVAVSDYLIPKTLMARKITFLLADGWEVDAKNSGWARHLAARLSSLVLETKMAHSKEKLFLLTCVGNGKNQSFITPEVVKRGVGKLIGD